MRRFQQAGRAENALDEHVVPQRVGCVWRRVGAYEERLLPRHRRQLVTGDREASESDLTVAVDAAPAAAAVEALDVPRLVAAVRGVEVAEAAQLGIADDSESGGAGVSHQEESLSPRPHSQRHGGDEVIGHLK